MRPAIKKYIDDDPLRCKRRAHEYEIRIDDLMKESQTGKKEYMKGFSSE